MHYLIGLLGFLKVASKVCCFDHAIIVASQFEVDPANGVPIWDTWLCGECTDEFSSRC